MSGLRPAFNSGCHSATSSGRCLSNDVLTPLTTRAAATLRTAALAAARSCLKRPVLPAISPPSAIRGSVRRRRVVAHAGRARRDSLRKAECTAILIHLPAMNAQEMAAADSLEPPAAQMAPNLVLVRVEGDDAERAEEFGPAGQAGAWRWAGGHRVITSFALPYVCSHCRVW